MANKSQFFRVATEGATTDGRNIDRATIEQLAATYNPKTYGARIWLEHIRGILPDSQFKAYGDVIAVKAEEVDTDSGKKLALFAQIEPTPEMVAINKAKQKLYRRIDQLETTLKATQDELAQFKKQMDETPGNTAPRPPATGTTGAVLAEF